MVKLYDQNHLCGGITGAAPSTSCPSFPSSIAPTMPSPNPAAITGAALAVSPFNVRQVEHGQYYFGGDPTELEVD